MISVWSTLIRFRQLPRFIVKQLETNPFMRSVKRTSIDFFTPRAFGIVSWNLIPIFWFFFSFCFPVVQKSSFENIHSCQTSVRQPADDRSQYDWSRSINGSARGWWEIFTSFARVTTYWIRNAMQEICSRGELVPWWKKNEISMKKKYIYTDTTRHFNCRLPNWMPTKVVSGKIFCDGAGTG